MTARDLSRDLEPSLPEFPVVLRGYDRPSVEQYIADLHDRLAEADERRREAESPASTQAYREVGPRVAEIFALAEAEAADIVAGARAEVQDALDGARSEAEAIVTAARTEARAQTARQQRDWEALLAAYEADRDRIRAEVDALNTQKATVLGELRRLRDALGQAPGLVEALAAAPASAPTLPEATDVVTRQHQLPAPGGEAVTGAEDRLDLTDEEAQTRVLPVGRRPGRRGAPPPEIAASRQVDDDADADDEFLDVPAFMAAPILEDEPEFDDDPSFRPHRTVEDEPEFEDEQVRADPDATQAYTVAEQAELADEP